MKNLYMSIGFMNPETNEFEFQKAEGEAKAFLQKLLEYTVENDRTRVYQFRSNEEMAEIVLSFAQAMLSPFEASPDLDIDAQLSTIVKRLLEAENKANRQLVTMGKTVKSGSLVLSLLRDDEDVPYFVFAKVDHTGYLEGAKLELQTGFSIEDRDIWKTAVVQIKEVPHVSVGDVLVYMDRQTRYWTDWFLGVKETRTDAVNTSTMYKAVSGALKRDVEKVSVNDYLILWQTLVHRINAEKDFDYSAFVDELIGEYRPQSDEFDQARRDRLKMKLQKLPENSKFDRQFMLEPGEVASLAKARTVKIAPGIELKINNEVNVQEIISEDTDEYGNKYIRIRCADGNVLNELN